MFISKNDIKLPQQKYASSYTLVLEEVKVPSVLYNNVDEKIYKNTQT